MKVSKTSNYDLFASMAGNREYNAAHATRIAESISNHNMLEFRPILCKRDRGGSLTVVDGQHRLAAAKKLGVPVYYTVADDLDAEDIRLLNAGQSGWSSRAFLNHFVGRGNPNYCALARFVESTGLPLMVSAALLAGEETTSGCLTRDFKDGKFTTRNARVAGVVAGIVARLVSLGVKFAAGRPMVLALARLVATGKYDAEKFARKSFEMVSHLHPCANWQQAAKMFSDAYDYRSPLDRRSGLYEAAMAAEALRANRANKSRRKASK